MNKYDVYKFRLKPCSEAACDILCALLGDAGFDSFELTTEGVDAYIEQDSVDEADVNALVAGFMMDDVEIGFERHELENRDWNEQWEKEGFEPIVVEGLCCIHDTRHESQDSHVGSRERFYDIRINPRMAFGSGTHATTCQLVELLLRRELQGKRCLDMGCGTGILAICMALRNAADVVGIDIDEFSVENSRENARLNNVHLEVIHGDARAIEGDFDLIVANIHRNIILADLPVYSAHLKSGGHLLISGFFETDIPALQQGAEEQGLVLHHQQSRDGWAVLEFVK